MKFLFTILSLSLLFVQCKSKEADETAQDTEEKISEVINTNDLSEGMDAEDLEVLKDLNDLFQGNNPLAEEDLDEDDDETNLARKEREYLERSIREGNLTIESEYSEIPMNFERVGIANLRSHLPAHSRSFIEDVLQDYFFKRRPDCKLTMRRLGLAKPEEIDGLLLDFFEFSKKELALLKQLPATELLNNEKDARTVKSFEMTSEMKQHLNSGAASQNFTNLTNKFTYRKDRSADRFLANAQRARDAFYKLNPGWYGEGEESGNTYIDSRKKFIYLPLGELSFADMVISHELGEPKGSNSEGVIGPPDMALEDFRMADSKICNLGINGRLTLEFTNNTLTDVNGPDLYVFEMGAIEPTKLEISKNGEDWLEIGQIKGGTAMVDISEFVKPNETFNYVRLTDLDTFSTLPGADVDAVASIGGALRMNLDSAVLFDTGKFQLKESAASTLTQLITDIQEIPKGMIIVEGHTDNVGDPKSNIALSQNRAQEVLSYLKNNLSNDYQFQKKGFGENQPVATNDTEEGRQKNRRVEILVIPTQ